MVIFICFKQRIVINFFGPDRFCDLAVGSKLMCIVGIGQTGAN